MASEQQMDDMKPSISNVDFNEEKSNFCSDNNDSSSVESVLFDFHDKKSRNPIDQSLINQKNNLEDEHSEDDSTVGSGLLYILEEFVEEFPTFPTSQDSSKLNSKDLTTTNCNGLGYVSAPNGSTMEHSLSATHNLNGGIEELSKSNFPTDSELIISANVLLTENDDLHSNLCPVIPCLVEQPNALSQNREINCLQSNFGQMKADSIGNENEISISGKHIVQNLPLEPMGPAPAEEIVPSYINLDHSYALSVTEKKSTKNFPVSEKARDDGEATHSSFDSELSPSIQNMLRATGLVSRDALFLDETEDERLNSELFRGFVQSSTESSQFSKNATVSSSSLPLVGIRKKLSKMLQREQTEIVDQLTNLRISCNCEEVYSLGPNGNLDRFTLDINNSWRDRKATVSWTPAGMKEAVAQTICQGILKIDGKFYRCSRTIPRSLLGNLYRSSPAHPLISLCDIHVANLRNHHCCPGCGDFCEAGNFRACSQIQGHFYHESCLEKDRSGDFRCLHCLQASHHIAVKIENPGLVQLDMSMASSDRLGVPTVAPPVVAFLKPRQPKLDRENVKNKYGRDFPLGFRISCAFLPARDADILETLLKDMDLQSRVEMTFLDLLNAIVQGNVTAVLLFLLLPANLQQFYTKNQAKSVAMLAAPVQVAIKQRQSIILSLLLQAGFPFDIPDKTGLFPFEFAALIGNSEAVFCLKKFYGQLPSSAFREISLRRLLEKKLFDAIALLFRFEFYNFDEFYFTEEEIFQTISDVVSSKNPVTITHFALCPSVENILRRAGLAEKMVQKLRQNSDFFDENSGFFSIFFRRIGIRSRISTSMAVPPSVFSEDHVVCEDLSFGREMNPVVVVNNFGQNLPPFFKYVSKNFVVETKRQQLALSGEINKIPSCSKCPRGLPCGQDCSCISLGGAAVGQRRPYYTLDGRLDRTAYTGQFLIECSSSCACAATHCGNSVTQKPSKGHFQIYRFQETNGEFKWGLRTVNSLPGGFFIGRLIGSVVLLDDLLKCIQPDPEEIFVLPKNSFAGGDRCLAVVTREYGNYTRFLARKPGGNVMAVAVISNDEIFNLPQIALFAKDVIEAGDPLVLDTTQSEVAIGFPMNLVNYDTAKMSFSFNAM